MVKLQNRCAVNGVVETAHCGAAVGGKMSVANSESCGAVARSPNAASLGRRAPHGNRASAVAARVCMRATVARQMRPAAQSYAAADGFAAR